MRILVVTPHPAAFPGSGAAARVFCCVRGVAPQHEMWLLMGTCWGDAADLPSLANFCHRTAVVAPEPFTPRGNVWARRMGRWRRALLGPPSIVADVMRLRPAVERVLAEWSAEVDFDLMHVHHSMTPALVEGLLPDVPRVVDLHNLMFHYYQRTRACGLDARERLEAALQGHKMARFEKRLLRRNHAFITTSEDDARRVHGIHPSARTYVVPNGVDTDYFGYSTQGEAGRLLFMGALTYPPNVAAVKLLVGEILPLVQRAHPDVHLDVVGMSAPADVMALADGEFVQVADSVPDVRPCALRAAIHVVPLRAGSGTRLKILEALSMGRAVVSTTVGAEGIDVRHGEHLMLADGVSEFARQVVTLMQDDALRLRLGANGRRLVEEVYDWRVVSRRLNQVYQATGRRAQTGGTVGAAWPSHAAMSEGGSSPK